MFYNDVRLKKEVESVETSVDWLTITVKGIEARERVYLEWERVKLMMEAQGHHVQSWNFKGYAGLRIGAARWGTRRDSDICMLSGPEACVNWLPFSMLAENVTRLDLAVTCHLATPYPDVAKLIYSWLQQNPDLRPSRTVFTFIENTNGGQTLYVGSRSSDQYARLYDKGKEQSTENPKGKIWRYEVEFKGDRAARVLPQLREHAANDVVERAIAATVYKWFKAREIEPIWQLSGSPMRMDVEATVTSDSLKLLWLTRQVRPSILQLLKRGHSEEVISALGLDKSDLWNKCSMDNSSTQVPHKPIDSDNQM